MEQGNKNSIAVYTSIFGDADDPKTHPSTDGVDYILFTDKDRGGQGVRVSEAKYSNNRMSAKWYKVFPHICLPEYRYTIFLDGSLQIKDPTYCIQALKYIGEDGIGLWKHPDRTDLTEECKASKPMTKYSNTLVIEQGEHYSKEGVPKNAGMWCTGTIVRDNWNPRMREAMELYMKEMEKWTYQDQISFPYIVWKMGLKICEFPEHFGTFDDNPWFYRIPHKNDD